MTPMPTLRDIDVERISFVGRPALRDAEDGSKPQPFLLWKSEEGNEEKIVPETDKSSAADTKAAVQVAQEAVALATARANVAVAKSEDKAPEKADVELIAKAEGKAPEPADQVKGALALLRKNRGALSDTDKATIASLAKEEDKEEINKEELAPAVRAYIEKQEAQVKAAIKESSEAVAVLKEERVKIRKAEFVETAKSLAHVPGTGTSEEFGETLMKLADADPEAAVKLISVLSGTETVLAKSAMWTERGSARPGAAGSAMDKITEQAVVLQKAEGEGKMTIEKAIDKVLSDPRNAELYTEYKREAARAAADA